MERSEAPTQCLSVLLLGLRAWGSKPLTIQGQEGTQVSLSPSPYQVDPTERKAEA